MPYTMTNTVTKPADKQWWFEVNPEGAQRYLDFSSGFPGIVSSSVENVNQNVRTWTTVFADKAAFDTFFAACQQNADWLARKTFQTANGYTLQTSFA